MFKKVFGQDRLFERLLELIYQGKAAGSYLFTGPEGIGKWAYGLLFAAAYCCESDTEKPCGKCRSCKASMNNNHPDVQLLFPFPNIRSSKKQVIVFPFSDSSNGAKYSSETAVEIERYLEEKSEDPYKIVHFEGKPNIPMDIIRDLRRFLSLRPMWGGKRVVLVSDIEKMAPRGTEIFLKTIEEPPPDTVIILTSSSPQKLPATLLSRCRVLPFQTLDEERIREYLNSIFPGAKADYRFVIKASNYAPGMARALVEEGATELRDRLLGLLNSARKGDKFIERSFTEYNPDFNILGGGITAPLVLTWILRDVIVMRKGGRTEEIINCDRTEILSGLSASITVERALSLLETVNDIKIAGELSNVLPSTLYKHLLASIKRAFR